MTLRRHGVTVSDCHASTTSMARNDNEGVFPDSIWNPETLADVFSGGGHLDSRLRGNDSGEIEEAAPGRKRRFFSFVFTAY